MGCLAMGCLCRSNMSDTMTQQRITQRRTCIPPGEATSNDRQRPRQQSQHRHRHQQQLGSDMTRQHSTQPGVRVGDGEIALLARCSTRRPPPPAATTQARRWTLQPVWGQQGPPSLRDAERDPPAHRTHSAKRTTDHVVTADRLRQGAGDPGLAAPASEWAPLLARNFGERASKAAGTAPHSTNRRRAAGSCDAGGRSGSQLSRPSVYTWASQQEGIAARHAAIGALVLPLVATRGRECARSCRITLPVTDRVKRGKQLRKEQVWSRQSRWVVDAPPPRRGHNTLSKPLYLVGGQ
ncbi:uncharacterized protein BJ171DRAFT_630334 [Polychytrium aggregatum]|uniref:uncharacterized protein n=1 Tax=Polychytrium aggregatum TaxID=110093 RepID=UPI0022FE47DD|nr:uncharacterized protein BJ171DRAFT_630334 [Polychytrium aggregatum]KAI9199715.1 hypothetical protein BJ171DRAFT_630334 [Polychytrium aggregatum]